MAEIFTRKFSEVSGGRFDPQFYMQIFENNLSKIKQKKHEKIGNLVELSTQGYVFEKDKEQNIFQYIEISNIDIENGHIRDISLIAEKDAPSRARLLVKQDDILVSATRPNRGAIAIVPKNLDGAVASTGFIVIRKVRDKILKQYLAIILKTNISLLQFQQRSTGGNYPAITQDDFKKCLIPLPPLSTQQHIIDLMDKAYKAKQEKENKAKELLDSIDSYLLEELGIILPLRANNTLDSRIYTQKISALSGSRFDANYHQPYYKKFEQALESGKYKTLRLVDICQFRRGSFPQPYGNQEWYGGANAMPFVQVADIDDNFELKEKTNQQISQLAQPKSVFVSQNTIILSIQGTIGRVAITQYDCYVDRTIAIFTELSNLLNQHFLAYMLSILFKNKADTARGITLKTITKEEFRNFKIPLPPLTEQERIAKEIAQRKATAKALKQEAKELLESAKKEVEHIILGG
ncbi:restriction endonuclease subunit S [Campylobacter upsaliensis]|nr:restriction endonuclease subunit S [Campylobacter upsaliensis]